MGKIYTVEVVKSEFQGQLFPAKQRGDLDTQMKILKVISMFKDAFLDFGNSFLEHDKTFEVSFGFVFDKDEEVSYAIGTDVSASVAERWRDMLEGIKRRIAVGLSYGSEYGTRIKCIDITINDESFKGYFQEVCSGDPHNTSIEIVEEVIREVASALNEQEQPIAKIGYVY